MRRYLWIGVFALALPLLIGCRSTCHSVGTGISGDRMPVTGEGSKTLPTVRRASEAMLNRFAFAAQSEDKQIGIVRLTKHHDITEPSHTVTGFFTDASPEDDVWDFSARYCRSQRVGVAVIDFGEAFGSCGGTSCTHSISDYTPDKLLALVGFTIQTRMAGTDQDVRSIAIMPVDAVSDSSPGELRISFNGSDTPSRGFTYFVQYALVPARFFEQVSDEYEDRRIDLGTLRGEPRRRFIAGFSFARPGFGGEAHLARFSLDLAAGTAEFADRDGGEPIRWELKYLIPRE